MFHFNKDKFDFWEIYESIKKFYPIGISKDESQFFQSYPKFKDLESIIIENIHDESNYKSRWEDFTTEIQNTIQKPVIGTTYGQAPCFSAYLELEKNAAHDMTRFKEIYFFVSLVGPYYTVIGQDRNEIRVENKLLGSTSYLIVSPEIEYAESFNFICNAIEKQFDKFKFIPFWVCKQTINGLDAKYSHEHLNSIFNVLFNNQIDLNLQTFGNDSYKSENWIKEGYIHKGGQWVIYPKLKDT
ncbi:MAG TPA: hypothetical protein VIH86_10695 [Puia sp.]|jgi:hypothetical protein